MALINGFDPVAWSIDGGRHRGELLRVLAYAATGGNEGIVSLNDCKVTQVGSGSQAVSIGAGAVLVRNRSANVWNQTYVANGRTPTTIDTPASTSTLRSHLVVVRIKDPQYNPWTSILGGASAADFQYVEPFIITNVPAGTQTAAELGLGYSAVALARLDVPANATNITTSMIKDLRRLAQPRSLSDTAVYQPADPPVFSSPAANGRVWFPMTNVPVFCPEWAGQMRLVVTANGMKQINYVMGRMRAEYGFASGDPAPLVTEESGIHHEGADIRGPITMAGSFLVPSAFRNKLHYVRTGTAINPDSAAGGGATGGRVMQDQWSTIVVDYTFNEVPV
jgi:hypothetical protein